MIVFRQKLHSLHLEEFYSTNINEMIKLFDEEKQKYKVITLSYSPLITRKQNLFNYHSFSCLNPKFFIAFRKIMKFISFAYNTDEILFLPYHK